MPFLIYIQGIENQELPCYKDRALPHKPKLIVKTPNAKNL